MRIYYCPQGRKGKFCDIEDSLKEMQKLVGGYIETLTVAPDLVVVCNEEGKLRGLKPNRWCKGDVICGNFFICGIRDGEMCNFDKKYDDVIRACYEEPQYDGSGNRINM